LRQRLVDSRLVLATGLAAALPVVASTVRGLAAGWTPEGDRAVIATRAYDVLTSLTPLLGPWSSTSTVLGEDTYHAGPLLYWLLAIPARLPGTAAFPVIMGVLNVAAIIGVVALAKRRGGRALMFATGGAVALMCASLNVETFHDIWNPTAPLLAFMLLLFVCWSLACGEHRLLPLAILLASFAMQCHLVFVLPSMAVLGVGLAGLIVSRRRRKQRVDAEVGTRSVRQWSLAAMVVAVVCWSGPIADQALDWAGSERGNGNVVNLVDAIGSRDQPAGATAATYAVIRTVGVPPWWLRAPSDATERTFEIFARPALPAIVSAVIILLALIAVTALGIRRGRADVAAAGTVALAVCAALAAVTASFPNTPSTIFSYSYASWWAAPVGMWTWLVVAWSSLALWSDPRGGETRRAWRLSPALPLLGVVGVGAVVAASQGPIRQRERFDATRTLVKRLDAVLPNPGKVRVESSVLDFETAVIGALRRRGGTVHAGDVSVQFGRSYARREQRYDHIVEIMAGDAPPGGGRRIARIELRSPTPRVVSLWLRPGR
jgi:hypothetical protein